MDLATRENAIIGICIVAAIVAFYALGELTTLSDTVRYAVVLGLGVILPMAATNYYSS